MHSAFGHPRQGMNLGFGLVPILAVLLGCSCLSYTQDRNSTEAYCVAIPSKSGAFHTGFVRPTPAIAGTSVPINSWIADQSNMRVWSKLGSTEEVKFAFRADSRPQRYLLCTSFDRSNAAHSAPACDVDIQVSFDTGLDLFDPNEAMVHKVKPVADDLRYLEGVIAALAKKYEVISHDEGILRDANESINNRLSLFFAIAIVSLVGLMAWQTIIMMRYFKSKKLVD